MTAKSYARDRLFGPTHILRGEIEAAFRAGLKEGRRRARHESARQPGPYVTQVALAEDPPLGMRR